jgi:hypothetical protein
MSMQAVKDKGMSEPVRGSVWLWAGGSALVVVLSAFVLALWMQPSGMGRAGTLRTAGPGIDYDGKLGVHVFYRGSPGQFFEILTIVNNQVVEQSGTGLSRVKDKIHFTLQLPAPAQSELEEVLLSLTQSHKIREDGTATLAHYENVSGDAVKIIARISLEEGQATER